MTRYEYGSIVSINMVVYFDLKVNKQKLPHNLRTKSTDFTSAGDNKEWNLSTCVSFEAYGVTKLEPLGNELDEIN